MQEFEQNSYLADNNAGYVENLYEDFLNDPESVSQQWRDYFLSLSQEGGDVSHATVRAQFKALASRPVAANTDGNHRQSAVDALIYNYRRYGHLIAKINPLVETVDRDPRLQLSYHELSDADLSETFLTRGVVSQRQATLKAIISQLQKVYCDSVGSEINHIEDIREQQWLQHYLENRLSTIQLPTQTQKNILQQLIKAETLEKYLDSKYVGQVRFSLEGGDVLIPMLDELVKRSRQQQIQEIVICMAHRGRVNVLLNIMGQSAAELFKEFEGKDDYGLTTGDVKYHRGYSRDVKTDAGPVHLSLAFNPSHLEFIGPVAMGSVLARQEKQGSQNTNYAMAVIIHGDAAFSGEGIVMEALSMSQTRAHHIGGSIHIVLNNQLGFTASNPQDLRSSRYCTDVAKMINAPIFHVNADDPVAAGNIMQLALEYRMAFQKDVIIDLVCYRRHGHQEADDPAPTQPLMYQKIKTHPTVRAIYAKKMIAAAVITDDEVKQLTAAYRDQLDNGEQLVETQPESLSNKYTKRWEKYLDTQWVVPAKTTISIEILKTLGQRFSHLPESFSLHRKVAALYKARTEMAHGNIPIDWGFAEMMAYATLLHEGHTVRLTGQDSRRGTFFHRHAAVLDQATGKVYQPLKHLSDKQAKVTINDSLLCECGALGFEYGYASTDPTALVIWEAQFGDFANVAQVIVDQFLSSGWQKWQRLSGVVLFLPHGYEGKGPEHSSARLERYLQLCAQDNIQVFSPSTPAQIFHLLRRQVLRPYRRPLVVMSPKSLLRHKLVVSSLEDLAHGELQLIIPEIDKHQIKKITRIIMCSGKVYYELLQKRREHKLEHIAIIRIEQLYPFPYAQLEAELQKYVNAKTVVWCQEEPKNQGAWFTSNHRFIKCMRDDQTLTYAGRQPYAAPAAGYMQIYQQFQTQLINEALALNEDK